MDSTGTAVLGALNSAVDQELKRRAGSNASGEAAKRPRALFDQRQKIYGAMTEWGIKPIAVLPKELWNRLCVKFGLWRFENIDSEGSVPSQFRDAAHVLGGRYQFVFSAGMWCMLLSLIVCFLSLTAWDVWGVLGSLSVGIAGFLVVCLCFVLIKKSTRFIPSIVPLLWPDRCDDVLGGRRINIFFPPPTEQFTTMRSLVVSRGLHPCIAAAPGAIGIGRKDLDDFEETVRDEWVRGCPVLYVISQDAPNMIAVLTQYGEFPSERAILDWLKKEGFSTF